MGRVMNAMQERYEGNFLEGLDIEEGKTVTLTVKAVAPAGTEKAARKQPIKDAILSFAKAGKRFIVNNTNWKVICAVIGKDESQWTGHQITIQRRYLSSFLGHQNVPCVRVIPPRGTPISMSVHAWMGAATPYTDDELKELKTKRRR